MTIQHLEQFHQRQGRLGLAVLVAREGIDATAEDFGGRLRVSWINSAAPKMGHFISWLLAGNVQNIIDDGQFQVHIITMGGLVRYTSCQIRIGMGRHVTRVDGYGIIGPL